MTAADKMLLLTAINRATAAGTSLRSACTGAGVPIATALLWRDTLAARGTLADARREHSGRKPMVILTAAEIRALRQLVFKKRLSEEAAIRALAKHPACSAATREFIQRRLAASESGHRTESRKARWPDSLRRAAHITQEEIDKYYGPDKARANAISSQRRLTYIDARGRELPLLPHTIWQFDDYSTNKPYWLEYAAGKFRVCRQILAGLDTFTHGWLGFYHVGKERDAYTSADCLTVILRCLDGQKTKPEIIILEQSRWKGNALRGIKLDGGTEGRGDGGKERRWGDIQDAGIRVIYVTDSRGKAEIEAGFYPLQMELEGGADIGHTRGLHERESDNYLAVNQGRRDPRHCGFTSLPESDGHHFNAAALLNARRKERQELGFASADELFAEFPVEHRPLEKEHRWLFEFPHKQEAVVGSIGRSLVGCTVAGKQHLFVVNGIRQDVFLGDGHQVLIAFDPERPHLGCHVANNDRSTANRDNWRIGQMLLPAAPPWDTVPRLDLRSQEDRGEDAHWKLNQGARRAAQTAFTAILPGGKRGLRTASRRNRQGDLCEVVIGGEIMDSAGASPHLDSSDRAEPSSAGPRISVPGVAARRSHEDATPAAPRRKTQPDAFSDDDDFAVVEAAAMQRAGVLTL